MLQRIRQGLKRALEHNLGFWIVLDQNPENRKLYADFLKDYVL